MPHLSSTTERHEFEIDFYKPDHLRVIKPKVHLDIAGNSITISHEGQGIVCGTPDNVIHELQQFIEIARFAKQQIG